MVALRPMTEGDLPAIERWLALPHVARWWIPETTVEAMLEDYRRRVRAGSRTAMLTVSDEVRPIGWCQWYRWDDYPAEATSMDAEAGEVGVDYAIGEPGSVGRGVGTQLIAALVTWIGAELPSPRFRVAVESLNDASRRVLEKNDFVLVGVRPVTTEPHDRPMAIYRRP